MTNNHSGMTLIVKTVTRLTIILILIYGVYIILQGHISPGGGFAGGIIIALAFIQLMLAFGKEAVINKLSEKRSVFLMSLGALVFLLLAVLGFMGHYIKPGYFSGKNNFELLSAGFISLSDIAVSLMVGMGVFTIFLALVLLTGTRDKR